MALRKAGSRLAITGPRSAAVGAPQHSGCAAVIAGEGEEGRNSNKELRSFMARHACARSVARVVSRPRPRPPRSPNGPRKNMQDSRDLDPWQDSQENYFS